MDLRDLVYMPAHQQIRLFRGRKLSPLEVLNAQIRQVEMFGDRINAVTYEHFAQARRAAKKSEARYRARTALPLDGVSVAVKDEFDRAGWKTTLGSRAITARAKRENHPIVDRLLGAGAILHIQTTAPEFHLLPVTWSDRWGVTRNPWNCDITPGGSSGGSAAVTAAGMSTLAIGSDIGGSLRIPAALCGLYGFNPPYGRNAATVEDALLLQASSGPLARNLPDMMLLQSGLAGPGGSWIALSPALELPRRLPPIKGWKIAFSMNQGWAQVDRDVQKQIEGTVALLKGHGAIVEQVRLDFGMSPLELRHAIEKAIFSTALGGEIADLPARKLTTYGRRFRTLALGMKATDAKQAAAAAARVHDELEKKVFAQGFRVLICPTVSTTRISADYDPTAGRPTINGKSVDPYLGWFQTSIFNFLNWMPVLNVPAGRANNGVPAGVQIAARPYDDLSTFAVAAALEASSSQLFSHDAVPPLN